MDKWLVQDIIHIAEMRKAGQLTFDTNKNIQPTLEVARTFLQAIPLNLGLDITNEEEELIAGWSDPTITEKVKRTISDLKEFLDFEPDIYEYILTETGEGYDTNLLPKKPTTKEIMYERFDYYYECKAAEKKYTLQDIADDTGYSLSYVKQWHKKYKLEKGIKK